MVQSPSTSLENPEIIPEVKNISESKAIPEPELIPEVKINLEVKIIIL